MQPQHEAASRLQKAWRQTWRFQRLSVHVKILTRRLQLHSTHMQTLSFERLLALVQHPAVLHHTQCLLSRLVSQGARARVFLTIYILMYHPNQIFQDSYTDIERRFAALAKELLVEYEAMAQQYVGNYDAFLRGIQQTPIATTAFVSKLHQFTEVYHIWKTNDAKKHFAKYTKAIKLIVEVRDFLGADRIATVHGYCQRVAEMERVLRNLNMPEESRDFFTQQTRAQLERRNHISSFSLPPHALISHELLYNAAYRLPDATDFDKVYGPYFQKILDAQDAFKERAFRILVEISILSCAYAPGLPAWPLMDQLYSDIADGYWPNVRTALECTASILLDKPIVIRITDRRSFVVNGLQLCARLLHQARIDHINQLITDLSPVFWCHKGKLEEKIQKGAPHTMAWLVQTMRTAAPSIVLACRNNDTLEAYAYAIALLLTTSTHLPEVFSLDIPRLSALRHQYAIVRDFVSLEMVAKFVAGGTSLRAIKRATPGGFKRKVERLLLETQALATAHSTVYAPLYRLVFPEAAHLLNDDE